MKKLSLILSLSLFMFSSVFGQEKQQVDLLQSSQNDVTPERNAIETETQSSSLLNATEVFYDFEDGTIPDNFDPITSGTKFSRPTSVNAWYLTQSSETYNSSYSLRSGSIPDSSNSNTGFLVNIDDGGGTLQFKYRVSSETSNDGLVLEVNSTILDSFSGESGWVNSPTYNIPGGQYYIDFWYTKNDSLSSNLDAVFVDDILVTGLKTTPLAITDVKPNAAAPGSNITIYGSGFSTTTTENIVKFDSVAATVQSALPNKLTVTVPETTPGFKNVSVVVGTDTAAYAGDFAVLRPIEPVFENANAGLTGVRNSSSSFADVDGDGDLDLLATGWNGSIETAALYLNDSNGGFSDSGITLEGVQEGSSSFGDVDGDGDLDLLLTGWNGSTETATLYLNDGNGGFSDSGVSLEGVQIGSTSFGDVDGDGDLDLLITGYNGSAATTTLYTNDGNGGFTDSGISLLDVYSSSSSFGDVDGDGDLDLLITGWNGSTETATLYLNDGNGGFSDSGITLEGVEVGSSSLGDADGDGDLDLLITGYNGSAATTTLYTNDGNGGFTDSGISLLDVYYSSSSFADVDGDGDLDLVITGFNGSTRTSTLYLNDGNGGFTDSGITLEGVQEGSSSFGDADGDGDLDLVITGLSSSGTQITTYYENTGTTSEEINLSVTGVSPNAAAPGTNITLYGKGFSTTLSENIVKFDSVTATVQSALSNKLTVTVPETTPGFKNLTVTVGTDTAQYAGDFAVLIKNESSFSTTSVITNLADGAYSVYAADLNGNGLLDVISSSLSDNKIAWYQNNGDGTFGAQQIISTAVSNPRSVYSADLNGDGHMDVLSASYSDSKIAWYQNNGDGTFGAQQVISTVASGAFSVYAADLNGNGLLDVISASYHDNKIAWYPNNGDGTFGAQQIISTAVSSPTSVYSADLNGNGYMDVLSASTNDDKIALYQNNGDGTFGAQQVISISADGAWSVFAADINGNGLPDALSASNLDNKIAWYPNNGDGTFGAQQIISTAVSNPRSVYSADITGDGFPDVLSASNSDSKIAWYPNNGNGTFGAQQVISTVASSAFSVYAADITGNGLLDVLSASHGDDKIAWYENTGVPFIELSSIADARQLENGNMVKVRGIITRASANIKKIQQDNSALHMYAASDFNQKLFNANVQQGDSVEVTGTLGEFSGLKELIDIDSVAVLSSGNPLPAPIPVTLSEVNDFENFESVLVYVENISTDNTGSDFQFSTNYQISQNEVTSDINLKIGDQAIIDFEGGAIPDFFNFTGIVNQSSNETPAYSLYPIGINDIEATLPDNIVYSISEAKALPDSSLVRVRGVATTPNLESSSRTSFFIQDETTGILVYNFGTPIRNIALGDSIEVTGVVETISGNKQVTVSDISADITVLSTGNTLPEPQLITFDEYKSAGDPSTDIKELQGTLVRFDQLRTDPTLWPSDINAASTGVNASTLRDSTLNIFLYQGTEVIGYTPPPSFDMIGVLHASGGPQVSPRFNSDIIEAAVLSPYDLIANEINDTIELAWEPSPSTNAGGYNIYRSTSAFSDSANATKLNTTPVVDSTFTDINIVENNSYFYRVAAVDTTTGNVSRLSNSSRINYKLISIQFANPLAGIPGETIKAFGTNTAGSSLIFDGPITSDSLSLNSRSFIIPDIAPGNYTLSLDFGGSTTLPLSTPLTVIDSVSGNSGNFTTPTVINNDYASIEKIYAHDLDGDLDLDLVITLNNSGGAKIAWLENLGNQEFSTPQVIKSLNSSKTYSISFGDFNKDESLDIAAVTENVDEKLLLENNSDGTFSEKVIALPPASGTHAVSGAIQVTSTDMDLDGFTDIAISSPADDQIYWYRNTGIDEWTLQGSIASVTDPGNVSALDINDDGDIDFLLTHQTGNTTAIIENNGNDTFSTPLALNASATQVTDQTMADINSDGNIDVVLISANNSRLDWYPNNNGVFDTQNIISQSITNPSSVSVNDLNGDGHPDIIVGTSSGQILWFENDGTGSFGAPIEIASNLGDISTLISSELTGTGTIDIVAGNTNDGALNLLKNINIPPAAPANVQAMTGIGNAAISWDANTEPYLAGYQVHRSVSFNSFAPISDGFTQQTSFTDDSLSNGLSYRYYVTAVDTNGNHSLSSDTLSITAVSTQISSITPMSGVEGTLVKLSGVGFSSVQTSNTVHFDATEATIIASDSLSIVAEVPTGLSGSVPISVTSEGVSYTYPAPFRILNANDGTFIDPVKNTGISGNANLEAADFNDDGLMDLIVPKPDQNSISIFFSDGTNPYASELEFPVSAATSVVRTANIFGDNYPDIIYITGNDNEFRILKNNGQSTNTTGFMDATTVSVTHLSPTDIFPADIDNDGFQDIIISSSGDTKISWYKNQSATGTIDFGTENVITNSASGVSSIYATDFNNDGLKDVLAALPEGNRVVWYRNEGDGTFTELVIDDGITTPSKVTVADFNNDGNSDVLFNTSGNDEVSLYLNDGTGTFNTFINLSTSMTGGGGIAAGDINGDGTVDVLASSVTDSSMYWFTNNADSTFSAANLISNEIPGASNVLLYDMNGDGNLDISTRILDESSIGVIPNFQIISLHVDNFLAGNNNIIDLNDQLELTFNTNLNSLTSLSTILANAITITNSKGEIFTPATTSHNENTLLLQDIDYYAVDTLSLSISGQYIMDQTAGRAFLDSNNNGEYDQNESDYVSPEFYTTLIGDFNKDLTVNFDDLVLFSEGWRNSDYQYETAPLNFGSSLVFPNARLNTDSNFNIDDLVSFIRYWNYSQERAEQAKAKELASKQNSEEEQTTSAKNVKASKQNHSSVSASEMDYISYEKLTSHNEYVEENEGIESTYLLSLSHPDSVQAISLNIEYDPENVGVSKIKDLDLFDIHSNNSNVFISRVDSTHGVITLNVANFGALSPIEKRDIASITFKSFNDRDSEITITSDIRVKNKEAHRQIAQKAVRVTDDLPEQFTVSQNYPNPFNPTTTIHYELAEQAKVTLTIYDILGRKVETLINENGIRPGYYKVKWDASRYASGMYIYVVNIRSNSGKTHTMSKKMILVK